MTFVLPVLLIAAWFAATSSGAVKPYQFASAQAVLAEFSQLATSGALWANLGASLEQISRTDEILFAVLLFALCGKLSESAMRAIELRLVSWTDTVPAR